MGPDGSRLGAISTPPWPLRDGRSKVAAACGMMYCHTMAKSKIAVTVDSEVLDQIDALVRSRRFSNRSRAFEKAALSLIERLNHTRLARACAQLDPRAERAMAEEGLPVDAELWPAD
jgi:Arc/MetJ-type ribon-helix-helix transcriptional regulator